VGAAEEGPQGQAGAAVVVEFQGAAGQAIGIVAPAVRGGGGKVSMVQALLPGPI
jgi:hypothetical protein